MLIILTLLVPLLGGAAMSFLRFQSGKARAIYVESVVCLTSLMVLSLLLTRYSLIYTCCIYVFVQVILVYSLYKLSRKALTENLETS